MPPITPNTKRRGLMVGDFYQLVRRTVAKRDNAGNVIKDKDNNPVTELQPIKSDEVMDFAVYDDHVVVVTKSGEKLSADLTKELKDTVKEADADAKKSAEAKSAKK